MWFLPRESGRRPMLGAARTALTRSGQAFLGDEAPLTREAVTTPMASPSLGPPSRPEQTSGSGGPHPGHLLLPSAFLQIFTSC